jgi:enoyl-[acyl-carrier protein] reductase II
MAGQSVGMVSKEQPTAEIISELVAQAARYLEGKSHLDKERAAAS